MRRRPAAVFAPLIAILLVGCLGGCASGHLDADEVRILYNRAASFQYPDRNPVIVIPGLLGSRLVDRDSGTTVWGAFGGDYADPRTPEGMRLVALPLDPSTPAPRVEADGVLDQIQVRLLGLPVQLKAYFHILMTLGTGGYRDEAMARSGALDYGDDHFTCFQFDFDWRLSNADNAARLHRFILDKREQVRRKSIERFGVDPGPVRFDIVTHSMGSLLTRYYLRYGDQPLPANGSLPVLTWAGAEHVERAILIGPPNAGSAKAIDQLVNGVRHAPGLPKYEAALIGTFPTAYELLPRSRHGAAVYADDPGRRVPLLDPGFWIEGGYGLAARHQEPVLEVLLPEVPSAHDRRQIALRYLRRSLARAGQFQRALDLPVSPPAGTELFLITGDSEATDAVMAFDPSDGKVRVIERRPGDGSVLRTSALMDERLGGLWQPGLRSPIAWRDVMFLPGRHFRITKEPHFVNNMLYRLLEEPRARRPQQVTGS